MTHEEKLDLILNEIKDHYGHKPIPENWERICSLVTDGDGISTGNKDHKNDPQLKNYLDFLLEEKYIKMFQNIDGDYPYAVATVKGLKFEGFANELKNTKTKQKIELRKSNILFGASVIAGLYALSRIVNWACHFFVWCHCP